MHCTTPHYSNYSSYNYNYITLHYTNHINYTTLHSTPLHSTPLHSTPLHSTNYNYSQLQLRYFPLPYARLHYTTLHYIARHSSHHHKYDCNYTTQITLYNYNSTTLQLQQQLRYTAVHPAVVGEVSTAITATILKHTTPTTFGQSVVSLCHPRFTTTNLSYRFLILKLPPPPCAVLLV